MKCAIPSCTHRSTGAEECTLAEPGSASEWAEPKGRRTDSLAVASIELGRALADRGATTFRARGTCMYPVIRPGDILHIDPRPAGEIAVGDIAVCRSHDHIFSHRTVETGTRDGTPYIITSSDSAPDGTDRPAYDSEILGVVSSIERSGRRLSPGKLYCPAYARFYFSLRLGIREASYRLRRSLVRALGPFQRCPVLKPILQAGLAAKRSRASFTVLRPLVAGSDLVFHRPVPADDFDLGSCGHGRAGVDRWRLVMRLKGGEHWGAWASFVRRPPECPSPGWWLDDLYVRVRYRGMGLREELIGKAEEILARAGCTLQRGDR